VYFWSVRYILILVLNGFIVTLYICLIK